MDDLDFDDHPAEDKPSRNDEHPLAGTYDTEFHEHVVGRFGSDLVY